MPELTVKQVAVELGVSVQMVRNYIRAGKLKAVRFGQRSWSIEAESFQTLKDLRTVSK